MKLQIVSDLHLDHYKDYQKVLEEIYVESDILIMAGDIKTTGFMEHNGIYSPGFYLDALAKMFSSQQIIFVPGNHDFWGTTFEECVRQLKQPIAPNLHVLYNDSIVLNGQLFVGTTLWFPDASLNACYRYAYPDFKYVTGFTTVHDAEYQTALKFIKENTTKESILVTHFVPHTRSIHPMYIGDPFNRFFAVTLDELLEQLNPKMVVHGHTHCEFDYVLECGTRVICNPYGYVHERTNPPYKNVIVEI